MPLKDRTSFSALSFTLTAETHLPQDFRESALQVPKRD